MRAGHVEIERHFYSVPFRYLREQVDVRVTERTVEIFFKGERIGVHPRSFGVGGQTTQPDHMPPNHRAFAGWTIAKLSDDAVPRRAILTRQICTPENTAIRLPKHRTRRAALNTRPRFRRRTARQSTSAATRRISQNAL